MLLLFTVLRLEFFHGVSPIVQKFRTNFLFNDDDAPRLKKRNLWSERSNLCRIRYGRGGTWVIFF